MNSKKVLFVAFAVSIALHAFGFFLFVPKALHFVFSDEAFAPHPEERIFISVQQFSSELNVLDGAQLNLPGVEINTDDEDKLQSGEEFKFWEDVPALEVERYQSQKEAMFSENGIEPSDQRGFASELDGGPKDFLKLDYGAKTERRIVEWGSNLSSGDRSVRAFIFVNQEGLVESTLLLNSSGSADIDRRLVRFCAQLKFEPYAASFNSLQRIKVNFNVE